MRRHPRPSRRSPLRDDRGSATAETAIVLPVVVVMVAILLLAGTGLSVQLRLESAARGAVRELARGEDEAAARAVARRTAGEEVQVEISADGAWVRVRTRRTLHAPDGPLAGAHWTLVADAEARREPQLLEGGGP
ncbi:TadE family type IV pilus minor pilin [Brachybacterium saurashtrense]|uniref:Pilus assembly protein n=1 Tax=Brachybacterium saurashtrense TaxID=556288 RepID=A0A345YQ30_9MICO|nr:TadE family type IV pilus minor pilin [Brachybacterium saurashtrense]AXK46032.1 pilus assembly protein [Brachybacterium saurashtrense]RRR23771.1 pilus assembly protein [Brachybacterium saurashtrense]